MQQPADVTEVDGVPIVEMFGESDLANVSDLRACLTKARKDGGHAVIVSLLHAEYFDSSTVHALLLFAADLKADRRQLLLVSPSSESGRRILSIFGIAGHVPVYETLPEALSAAHSVRR